MDELATIGKMLTIFILLALYGSGLAVTYTVLRQKTGKLRIECFPCSG